MDLFLPVSQYIVKHNLLQPKDKVILAVSGGPDSTAMVDILVRFSQENFPISIALACLDHGLWPESREHKEKIQPLADRYSLVLFWEQVLLLEQGKTAIEERGREARYRFLESVAQKWGATKIAVAHQANDLAETVLFHFLKGAGIMGLSAMAPKRPIFKNSSILLIRPLLGVEKSQIIAYLKMRNIPWWDDPSNTYDMTRNRLRHQVIPFLQEKGYKDATSALCRTAKRCQEISAYLQTQADFFLAHSCQNFCPKKTELEAFLALVQGKNNLVSIPKEKWDSLSLALLPFVLQRIYEGFGQECLLRERHYEIFQKWKKQNQTTWQLPGDVLATRQFYSVCFYWQDPKIVWKIPQSFSVPAYVDLSNFSKLEASFGNWQAWKQSHPTNTLLEVCVNKENTELPLHLEFCKNEDKIHPFGFPSQRKIFHILSDAKIPPPIRKKILTVRDNRGKILWVPGIAVSEQNLATSDNTEVIILKITAH